MPSQAKGLEPLSTVGERKLSNPTRALELLHLLAKDPYMSNLVQDGESLHLVHPLDPHPPFVEDQEISSLAEDLECPHPLQHLELLSPRQEQELLHLIVLIKQKIPRPAEYQEITGSAECQRIC